MDVIKKYFKYNTLEESILWHTHCYRLPSEVAHGKTGIKWRFNQTGR